MTQRESDARYVLLGELGRGSSGAVFLARTAETGERVALKTLPPSSGPSALERLARERALLERIEHPHVVRVRGWAPAGTVAAGGSGLPPPDGPALALELLDGPSLAAAGLEGRAALSAWVQVAHALEALHARGLVHRDVRPSNVLLRAAPGREGLPQAVLVDLGLATESGRSAAGAGTPDYAAPETLEGATPMPAADVHGLGGLLHFLVTGRAPWSDLPLDRALAERRVRPPARPPDLNAPDGVWTVIERLLAPEPAGRPPSALAAVRLLNAETGASWPDEPTSWTPRPGLASFVGRAELLSRVDELLEGRQAEAPAAHVVRLRGAPGSGRSRLLAEIGRRARVAGLEVTTDAPAEAGARAVVLQDPVEGEDDGGAAPTSGLWFVTAGPDRAPGDLPAEDLTVGPLAEEECLELAVRVLGLPPIAGGDGDALRAASGGLPGPLEQLVAALAESGGLQLEAGRLKVDRDRLARLPTVEERVRQRLDALSAEGGVLLEVASVLETPATPRVLGMVARETDLDALGERLAELLAAGVVRLAGEVADGPLLEVPEPVRTTCRDSLKPARRRILHLAAAGALAETCPGTEAEQASHLDAAGAPQRAAPLHAAAGRRLLGEQRPREAARHLSSALAHAADGPERAGLALALARAAALRGDAEAAVAGVEEAVAGLPGDEARAEAFALAAEAASHAGDAAVAERACRRARRLFRRVGSRVGRAECTARLAFLAAERGDLRRARAAYRAVLAVARAEDDAGLEARALNNLGNLARREGRLDEAARLHGEARSLRLRAGDVHGAAKAMNNLGIVHGLAGRATEAAEAFGEAVVAFRRCGDRREEARSLNNRGMALWLADELDEADRAFGEAAGLLDQLGDRSLVADALGNRGLVAVDRGRLGEGTELLERAVTLRRGGDPSALARVLVDAGDARRAAGDLDAACDRHAEAARCAGEGAVRRVAETAALLDRALRDGSAEAVETPADLESWPREWALRWCLDAGLLCEVAGDAQGAEALGERAADLAAEGGGAHERLAAEILRAGPSPQGDRLAPLEAALARISGTRHGVVAWRARLHLARGLAAEGRHLSAGAQAEMALGVLTELAESLPEAERERFLGAGPRAAAREELATFLGGGSPAAPASPDVAPVLLNFVRLLNAQLEVGALLPRVVDFAIEVTGADRGCLILFDDGPEAVRVARSARGEDLPRERFRHSRTVVEAVRTSGRPVVIESFAAGDDGIRSESVHELQLGSATSVPLPSPAGVEGGLLGAIYVDSLSRRDGFTEREVDTLSAMAAHAATAIVNAQLLARVRAERESLASEVERLRSEGRHGSFGEILGRSAAMRDVFALLDRVAPSEASVLIEGESGTGKELAARSIHEKSRRGQGPFVAVDCGSLPESLVESELFGHRRGAFTGADRDRPGLFEQASGGTIFLDEIGGTSASVQSGLLRVLQEREVRRIGDNESRPVDVRVVAATNRPLADEVAAGRFREDLYYRLNVVAIRLPPLRERPEDVPLLARHFLRRAAERESKPVAAIGPAALQLLARFPWPGNVRQLQNVMERAVVLAEGDEVAVEDLPPAVVGRGPRAEPDAPGPAGAGRDLWAAVVEQGASFWDVVRKPFLAHDITRSEVVALVSRALMRTGGSYKDVTRLFGLAECEYKRFMDFLRINRCKVDFRPFRAARRKAENE